MAGRLHHHVENVKTDRSLATRPSIVLASDGVARRGDFPSAPSPRGFAVSSAQRLEEMRERRQRRWSWWVGKGAVAMAILAALALAATVLLAQRALANAADIVIRGDGDTLIAGVVVDLWETAELTPGTLAAVIAKHGAQ